MVPPTIRQIVCGKIVCLNSICYCTIIDRFFAHHGDHFGHVGYLLSSLDALLNQFTGRVHCTDQSLPLRLHSCQSLTTQHHLHSKRLPNCTSQPLCTYNWNRLNKTISLSNSYKATHQMSPLKEVSFPQEMSISIDYVRRANKHNLALPLQL